MEILIFPLLALCFLTGVLIVTKLRAEKRHERLIKSYKENIEAKDKLISEQDKLIAAQDRLISELRRNIELNRMITGNHYSEIPSIKPLQ